MVPEQANQKAETAWLLFKRGPIKQEPNKSVDLLTHTPSATVQERYFDGLCT
jgi:hypothetical protein